MSRLVAWTGHRPEIFLDAVAARAIVDAEARAQRDAGATAFLVGGQRGVDAWAALAAIELALPFRMVLPFNTDEFTCDWVDVDREILQETLVRAVDVRVAGGYSLRNRQLATEAQLLVAVWTRTRGGGTAETIDFARAASTPVHEIVLKPSPTAGSVHGRGI
jgi:hypothetical protein